MNSPLLQTKLHIPRIRQRLVARPRLIKRLNEGLHRKLTLIAAPAGYGKTTLISSWIDQLPGHQENMDVTEKNIALAPLHPRSSTQVAWLSLDETDNDLTRFLRYTIAALQTVDDRLGRSMLPLLQLPNPPPVETLMTLLINDVAALEGRIILVFDDYHLIESLEIHTALAFLLDRLPPQLHLVILSREDPPFPLARLRVRRQLTEIRSHDLQFSLAEATDFLNQTMQLNLSPDAIAALEQRTEGWIAGLQMAAIAVQSHLSTTEGANPTEFVAAFAGDDRYLVDYLLAEVLALQPPHVLDFLQQTSILNRFTAALCDAITEQSNAAEILPHLEEANLFVVALDNRREWYRYHHLFGDLLRHRQRQANPAALAELHSRASAWYQALGFTDEAIQHALTGEAYSQAATLIEAAGLGLVGAARLTRLQSWIAVLPEALVTGRPYLSVLLAWVSVLHRQADAGETHLAVAESAIEPDADDPRRNEIICQMAMLHGYVARLRYDLSRSIDHIQQAIRFLPDDNPFLQCTAYLNLGGNYWFLGRFGEAELPLQKAQRFVDEVETNYPAMAAVGYLTNAYFQQGKLKQAAAVCQQVSQTQADDRHPPPALAYVLLEQGAVQYEQNQLVAATDSLTQAIELGENLDGIVNIGRAMLGLARISMLNGQPEEAAVWLVRAEANRPPNQVEFDYYRVRLWLAQGNLAAARQWAEAYRQRRNPARPWHGLSELTLAHGLLAEQQTEAALEIVNQTEAAAHAEGMTGWRIRSLALKSICQQVRGDTGLALESLRQALLLAEPAGYRRTFIDHGPPMAQLLQKAAAQGIALAYVAQLLVAFPVTERESSGAGEKFLPLPLVEPLTAREISILRLMAAGLSNREIATELCLSINTIKWYSSQIYGKLGVKKRAEAVDRAHALGIL